MSASATEGTILTDLIALAKPPCRAAELALPRRGRGASPTYPDWKVAVLIFVAVAARRKSKSAQYRYLTERKKWLEEILDLDGFPARSTYFDRSQRASALLMEAVRLQGRAAIKEGLADATVVAADKSLVRARGPGWPRAAQREGRRPRGADPQADWGDSEHHGWVYGYGDEVVVSATRGGVVFPLMVSAGTASRNECRSFRDAIPHLPRCIRGVAGDAAYDSNALAEAIEHRADGRPTGRRFLCPMQTRGAATAVGRCRRRGQRERSRQRRAGREAFFRSPKGQRLYRQRGRTVEPFNEWFKTKFDLHQSAWHRGPHNNHTQLTAAVFVYQLILRHHHRTGRTGGATQWILDAL